jgi:hypothetical protein
VLSGEGVVGGHVDDIASSLSTKLGMAIRRRIRRIVRSVWVGEITHWGV